MLCEKQRCIACVLWKLHVQVFPFPSSFQEPKALLRRHKLESHLLQVAAAGLGYSYTEPVMLRSAIGGPLGVHSYRTSPPHLPCKVSPMWVTQRLGLGLFPLGK